MSDVQQLLAGARGKTLSIFVLGVIAVIGVVASGASAASQPDPPLVSVGPIASPNGTTTAAGSVSSDGQTDACADDQHAGVDPSASNAGDIAGINDGGCQATAAQATGTQTPDSPQTGRGARAPRSPATGSRVVSAANAVGLRIARVLYVTSNVAATRRFRVLVTLRDLRGRLVRDGIVSVSGIPGVKSTISGIHSTFSDKLGRARLVMPTSAQMLGRRLFLRISARTPTARAQVFGSVLLPRIAAP